MAHGHLHKLLHAQICAHGRPNREKVLKMLPSKRDEESLNTLLSHEWYEGAFAKLTKLSCGLKNVDLVGERVISMDGYSSIFDEGIKEKLQAFKSLARVFLGSPSVQESLKNSAMRYWVAVTEGSPFFSFSKPNEREPMTLHSLIDVFQILRISTVRRRLVRTKVFPSITHPRIWTGTLIAVLETLKCDMCALSDQCPSPKLQVGQQIVSSCLEFLERAVIYGEQDSAAWMRPVREKNLETMARSPAPSKWGEVCEMLRDIVITLTGEKLFFHEEKLEAMIEGLSRIKDFEVDKEFRHWESRHQASPAQEELFKMLGHSSRCLFVLLQFYICNSTRDVEIEMSSGVCRMSRVYKPGANKYRLCLGRILMADEERVVWSGVRQLDRALALCKFVWEVVEMDGDLELQGHLYAIGAAPSRSFEHRGNRFFVHGISL